MPNTVCVVPNTVCEYKSASWNKVSLVAQAGHSQRVIPGSDCTTDFGFRVITLKSHRRTGLRRPLRRDPDGHAHGFTFALPRRAAGGRRPAGPAWRANSRTAAGPRTLCRTRDARIRRLWCLLFVFIRQGLRGGSGPQRWIRALGEETGNPIRAFHRPSFFPSVEWAPHHTTTYNLKRVSRRELRKRKKRPRTPVSLTPRAPSGGEGRRSHAAFAADLFGLRRRVGVV